MYSSDFNGPAALGVIMRRGKIMSWSPRYGAMDVAWFMISVSQLIVARQSRSFHRPWPKMNAYGFEGLVGDSKALNLDTSSGTRGYLSIISTGVMS